MHAVYLALIFTHVAFGFVGLAAFWVPLFSTKGGSLHVKAGTVFKIAAYVVAATAFTIAVMTLIAPWGTHPEDRPANPADLPGVMAQLRAVEAFLAYLAIITLTTVYHGVRVMETKRDPAAIRTPFHTLVHGLSIAAGAGSLLLGLLSSYPGHWIFVALSPIGFLVGLGGLRYARRPRPTPMAHWTEHLAAMIGGGIAFTTAFLVFGLRRFVEYSLEGVLGLLPWILPTVVGTIAIALLQRHYRQRFERGFTS